MTNIKYSTALGFSMADIKISGSLAVALALFAFLAISTGIGFNEVIEGLGTMLIWVGCIVIVVLIVIFILKNM